MRDHAVPISGFSTAPVVVQGLVVTNFTKTATGFTVTLSEPFTPADLTMYGLNTTTVQDVTMTGTLNGPITGTLYLDPTTPNTIVFKASNAYLEDTNVNNPNTGGDKDSVALPDDTYTVTLKSGTGTNGFVDASGNHLDGKSNGGTSDYSPTPYATTFQDDAHANANPVPVLGIPDFARGPDPSTTIAVPILATGNTAPHGIPITLYNAAGVTDATFTLTFNPQILTPTAGGTGDSTVAGSTFTMGTITSVDSTHSTVSFIYHNATAKSGTVILGDITATVPASANAIYKTKELLALTGITVNGAATVQAANGIHVDAYVGDVHVTALPAIDASDALDANTIANAPHNSGFTAYGLLDPAIIGAFVPGSLVTVGPADVTALFSKAAHLTLASLPNIPASVTSVNVSGADPTVSLAGSVQATNGIVSVPVLLDHPDPAGSTGMTEAHLALTYDPSVLSVSSSDITLGSIPGLGAGWQITSEVDAATGQIGINLFNPARTPITATQAGSLVNIAFHVMSGTTVPATAVQLVNQVAPNGQRFVTDVDDSQGPLTLSPGMDRLVISTGITPVTTAAPVSTNSVVTATVSNEHATGRVPANVSEDTGRSLLLGSESGDELAFISNGAVAGETATVHAVPASVIVTGALSFQSNQSSVAATQAAGQVFQIGNAPLVNAILGTHSPQQLADRLFLALARGTDALAEFNSLSLFQNNLRDVAAQHPDWLALASRSATESSADTLVSDGAAGQAVSNHLAVVDKIFAQLADDSDDFSDFGEY